MSEKMFSPSELSDFHKKRALDVAEMVKSGADMTPEGEVVVPDELQRKKRIEYYLESTKKEIEDMRAAGREEEAKTMEKRLGLSREWYEDGQHHIYDVFLFGDRDEVVYDDIPKAKKEMDRVMFLRAEKAAWEKELGERIEQKKNLESMHLSWTPIDFRGNLETYLKQGSLEDSDAVSFIKKFLMSDREDAGEVSGDVIRECHDTEFGNTANNSPKITEEHKRGLECLLGYQIPKNRLTDIHYTYTPDRQLAAVVLTLGEDEKVSFESMWSAQVERQSQFATKLGEGHYEVNDREAYDKAGKEVEKEFRELIHQNPFLGRGSLIIKKDGTRYFIPEVTWKQYPTATPSGRIVMTFAGGASRGIFDEEVCYTNSGISTSTGSRSFSVNDADAYKWREGISRDSGITKYGEKQLPPARMKFDNTNNVVLVGVDSDNEDGSRIRSNLE